MKRFSYSSKWYCLIPFLIFIKSKYIWKSLNSPSFNLLLSSSFLIIWVADNGAL